MFFSALIEIQFVKLYFNSHGISVSVTQITKTIITLLESQTKFTYVIAYMTDQVI